jgi:hypothetical protein
MGGLSGVSLLLLLLVGAALIDVSIGQAAITNLALHQPTIQSDSNSTPVYPPSLAVDGTFYYNYYTYGSPFPCTNPASQIGPWWAVDLGAESSVNYVVINSRGDCCAEQLSNFTVGLTNVSPWTAAPPNVTQGHVCGYYPSQVGLNVNIYIYCDPKTAPGRYLFIKRMDITAATLALCEVQVWGSVPVSPNLALNKPTIQSSTSETYNSSFAVDGAVYPTNRGSAPYPCAQTNADDQAWWAVDLGAVTTVTYVIINVRSDCCQSLTANFVIGLTNVSPWVTQRPMVDQGPPCAYQSGALAAGNNTISCNPDSSPGRYLFVKRSDSYNLSFCEIQVFSAMNGPTCPGYVNCIRNTVAQSGCSNGN